MPSDAASFFEAFCRELGSRGIPFAILHGYEQLPEQMPSDIDYVVRCQDLPKLLPIQMAVAKQQGWVLGSIVQAKLHAQYAVFFDGTNPSRFIQLDACGHYVERGCFILRDRQMLENCRTNRFMKTPAPAAEFAYLLAKSLIKKKSLETHLPRMKALWEADRAGAERLFRDLMGSSVDPLEEWFTRSASDWEEKLRSRIRRQTGFGPLNLFRESLRAVRRILRPVGMHVVILGPDGVGKSTLIARLSLPCFRRVRQFHFRPGILGKNSPTTVTQPHAQPPRSRLASLAKTFYYFADHWLGYVLKTYPAKVRNELVVFDRSFEDVLVDPLRYRLSVGDGLARWLSGLMPRADLTIVLDADPQVVHARKPELDVDELRKQREILQKLADRSARWFLVSACDSPDQVAQVVRQRMVALLAKREERRNPALD
jgi:thymidylate kinase